MNLQIGDGNFQVTLSERNLLGLLEQLDRNGFAVIHRSTDAGMLHVAFEKDETHYHSPMREEEVRGKAGWSGLEYEPLKEIGRPGEQDTVEMPVVS